MNDRIQQLVARIRDELSDLDRVVTRAEEGWQRSLRSSDDYYLDGVALNLHGFYAGLERIFALIATTVDGAMPEGENWHHLSAGKLCAADGESQLPTSLRSLLCSPPAGR